MRTASTAAAAWADSRIRCELLQHERFRAVPSEHLSDAQATERCWVTRWVTTRPNWGVGVNMQIPLRNRTAQADQVRSQMEYRQSQMRMQQLYTQIRIQVINGVYALTNDRAAVQSSQSARDYAAQALDAEQKKYRLGASTTANVLQMERNLATAEDNVISADAAYARDRASLSQILSNILDKYGVSINRGGERNDLAEAARSGTDGAAAAGSAEAADGCASADSAVEARDQGIGIGNSKRTGLRRCSRGLFCLSGVRLGRACGAVL